MPAIADTGSHIEPWFAVVCVCLGLLLIVVLTAVDEIRKARTEEEEADRGTPRRPRG